ncbi:MAG: molybdopterin molybdotransferase MoeA [Albidovulum sp.]|nr:molybdopterin molybdotransferase MoeA [Albidovulum sp.]
MISLDEALRKIFDALPETDTEDVPIYEASGRVLARWLEASRDQPPFDASAMDGYAVRKSEARPRAEFAVVGEVSAGENYSGTVRSGEAVRIFTGAPLPVGCDHVIIQEDAERNGTRITLRDSFDSNSYVRPAGCDFRAGSGVGAPKKLSPVDTALLASMNHSKIPVYRRPVIALLPTGNELSMPGDSEPGNVIASNPFALKGIFEEAGAEVRLLPIAKDNERSLSTAMSLARDADILITIGGASVGKYDLVRSVAESLGAKLLFHGVAVRPGKPLMAGILDETMLLAFPGNPVSSIVCAHVVGIPAIVAMQGLGRAHRKRNLGRLETPLGPNGPREHFMRAFVKKNCGFPSLQVFERQDSSLLSVMASANALVVRPPFGGSLDQGAEIEFIDLEAG